MRIGVWIGLGVVAAALTLTPATAGARPVTPEDIDRLRDVAEPQVDPSGQWVAYSVTATDVEADETESHLWMTRWDGGETVQLTNRKGENESAPRFSPDGRWLSFISSRTDEKEEDQLWLMDRKGGEGQRLPGVHGSVLDVAWSPDSKMMVLLVQDPDPNAKKDDGEGEAAAGGANEEKKDHPKPIVINRFQFKRDIDGYLGEGRQRLWIYDLASRTARRLTTGDYDEALPAWSPDGRSIAFSSTRAPDPDRTYDSNLYVATIGAEPVEPRALTTYKGADNDSEWESYPAWSPDGRSIAYLQGGPVELFSYGVHALAVVPAKGGAPRVLTAALDRNVQNPVWTADGKSIRFTVEDDGAYRVASVSAAGGAVKPVLGGLKLFSSLTPGRGDSLALRVSSFTAPPEVYAFDGKSGLRQLSRQNDAWLKEVTFAPVERTVFRSADGTEIHGFLVRPLGGGAGPYPTILHNHGGPQWQWEADFDIKWQIFASHGYAVVATNPRGSTGRGEAFAKALYADWGGVAVPDALAGIDDAVARGIADPKRLFVGGWSYGGMLTDYVIASDQRFVAAVSGASIGNALAGYGTDQYILDYETELGLPWRDLDVWLKNSYPFFHNDRIVTPTLFMVGDQDFNVPLLNSEQLYQGLKSRNIDTELVIYPDEFHTLTRPSFLRDRMTRWLAWYDDHLPKAPGAK